MTRRKIILTTAAAVAIGVAFAAQTSSVNVDRRSMEVRQRDPWVPGTNMLMSAHETGAVPVAPPR